MLNIFFKLSFLTATLFLFGCSTAPLTKDQKSNVNNVATAVLFDDSLPVAYIGTTIFNNNESKVNIAGWNLNGIVTQEINEGLKSIKKTLKPVAFNKQKIKSAMETGDTAMNRFLGDPDKNLNEYLLSTALNQGAKYLFVFLPIAHGNFHLYPKGFGLYCRTAFGIKGDWEAYSLFHVALWDLTTKKKVFQTAIAPNETAFKSDKSCEEIEKTTPEKFAALFKKQFQDIAKKSADLTLKQSGLFTE